MWRGYLRAPRWPQATMVLSESRSPDAKLVFHHTIIALRTIAGCSLPVRESRRGYGGHRATSVDEQA